MPDQFNDQRKKRLEVYRSAIEKWGEKEQYLMAQEEATELALAVRKHTRKDSYQTYLDLVDEVADMEIMIEQLKEMNKGRDMSAEVARRVHFKVNRLKTRVEKSDFNAN